MKEDLEELLDNENEEIIGTIKYLVDYIGFNGALFCSKKWINSLSNSNFNASKFLNSMKQSRID